MSHFALDMTVEADGQNATHLVGPAVTSDPIVWPGGLAYDPDRGALTIDGVTFVLSMLRDLVAALTPGARLGPVFLQRQGDRIEIHCMDVLDIQIIHRCQAAPEH